jgi:hypothetical protein
MAVIYRIGPCDQKMRKKITITISPPGNDRGKGKGMGGESKGEYKYGVSGKVNFEHAGRAKLKLRRPMERLAMRYFLSGGKTELSCFRE